MPHSPLPDTPAIDLRDVVKAYRRRVFALAGIAMHVRRGEIFGLLGPNGAGKSTLVKCMMTVIRPTSGGGMILGKPMGHKPTLGRVGYLPENHRFPSYLTGRQTLDFFAAMSNVDRHTRRKRAEQMLELVGMASAANTKISTYSKGMKQRIGLGVALMNDPELVLLDEPTDGVDPVGRHDIRNVLVELKNQGKTVFINSHLLSELEMICDRVAILVRGMVVKQGTLDELTLTQQCYQIELATSAAEVLVGLDLPGRKITAAGQVLTVDTINAVDVQPLVDQLRLRGVVIQRMQAFRPSLEDLFMQAVRAMEVPPTVPQGFPPGVRS